MKHKLKPLKETNKNVCNATRVCVVERRKFLDTMWCEHMCFSIIHKDGKEVVEDVPVEVANFLEEFLDIVSDNILDGLIVI